MELRASQAVSGMVVAAFVASAIIGGMTTAQAQTTTQAPPAKTAKAPAKAAAADKDDKSAGSYSIGVSVGETLRRSGVSADSLSVEKIVQGLRDSLSGKAKMGPADQQAINKMLMAARNSLVDKNHAAAKAFLDENGKKKDVVTTASGLEYKVITPGAGESPKASDTVTVNYRGTLLDGTEFDSSYKRNQPATFPVSGVIKGWTEALQLMKPGSKVQLWIPPQLAYDVNSPPPIPAGSLLVFEVELIGSKPAANPPTGAAGPRANGAGAAAAAASADGSQPPK